MGLRRRISRSRLAPLAIWPARAARVARYDAHVFVASVRWLFTSREHHNYTYDLTPASVDQMAWFVSVTCEVPISTARGYLAELETDTALRNHIKTATAASARRGLADRHVRYARRAGWYAIVRATRPAHVVETGVDKGLGTCVLAAALQRNAAEGSPGRVTAIDINPEAGYLVRSGPVSPVVDLVINDSLAAIAALGRPVDLFIHDSDHAAEHERNEFLAVEPKLSPKAYLLTDNGAVTTVLSAHAEATNRNYLFVREEPARHWFPGDGIGLAWRR